MNKEFTETHYYRALGMMSGTSLDGLDLVLAEFTRTKELNSDVSEEEGFRWDYKILKSQTVVYGADWKEALLNVKQMSAEAYFSLHHRYGHYMASEVNRFLEGEEQPDLIASHGHTVFHRPDEGYSTQIGCGATIAAHTGLEVVCDFRTLDTALDGQGAPLVPIGDQLLFGQYESCLNIGGIANISYDHQGQRIAYDIGIANMALNHFASQLGQAYDRNGELAASGTVHSPLLSAWNALPYYQTAGTKSMGREWFETEFLPAAKAFGIVTKDLLATAVEHIAIQIATTLNEKAIRSVLITGGGAYNGFLLQRLRAHYVGELIVPEPAIVEFKEALIFAFLGTLRHSGQINTLRSVTGARMNSSGGAIYKGNTGN